MRRSDGSSLSRRAAITARSVGGTTTSARLLGDSDHLLDEQCVAAGGARILSRSSGNPLGDQLDDVLVAQRADLQVTGHVGRRSVSSGRAMQSSSIGLPEESSATCSTRSRNVCSPHWMSSKTTTSGSSAAARSSVLRKAQAISSADVAVVALAEQGPNRRDGRLLDGKDAELLQAPRRRAST